MNRDRVARQPAEQLVHDLPEGDPPPRPDRESPEGQPSQRLDCRRHAVLFSHRDAVGGQTPVMADAGRVQPGLQGGKVVPDRARDGSRGGRLDRAGQAVDEGIRVLQGRSLKTVHEPGNPTYARSGRVWFTQHRPRMPPTHRHGGATVADHLRARGRISWSTATPSGRSASRSVQRRWLPPSCSWSAGAGLGDPVFDVVKRGIIGVHGADP